MKRSHLKHAMAAAVLTAMAALPAQATVVDFEDAAPALGAPSYSSGGFDFASTGTGFSGIDSAGAFVFGNAPANSSGQFLFALNGDGLTMTRGGSAFSLYGFDASFVAPLGGLGAGIVGGRLHIEATTANGVVVVDDIDFSASDAAGDFNFSSFTTNALANPLLSLSFTACVYESTGCTFGALLVPPQFALDNFRVPEPGSAALALVALGLLAARRRQSV